MSGHNLMLQMLAKHGVDRYPTPELALMKLVEEVGELASAMLQDNHTQIQKELGDVGIFLEALAHKLKENLTTCMWEVVNTEKRSVNNGLKESKYSENIQPSTRSNQST